MIHISRTFMKPFLLIIFLFLIVNNVWALVPPMSVKELKEQSDLIVTGYVKSVEPFGRKFKDSCYQWQKYVATFEVEKVEKGSEEKLIKIYYNKKLKDRSVHSHCVGGQTSYLLHAGSKYKLYLDKFSGDDLKSENLSFEFVNWSGVVLLSDF